MEGEYLSEVAIRRRPVLLFIFCFDVACYVYRLAAKCVVADEGFLGLLTSMGPQLANMAFLYGVLFVVNQRSCRKGPFAARQVGPLQSSFTFLLLQCFCLERGKPSSFIVCRAGRVSILWPHGNSN